MSGYKRPFLARFIARNSHRIKSICEFTASVAAALIFGLMFAAPLLHLGNTSSSGPAGSVSDVKQISLSHHYCDQEDGDPDPGTIASGAGLDLLGVEL